jgi:hypothetical protein
MIYDCHGKTYLLVKEEFENWLLLNQSNLPIEVITGNSDDMKRIIMNVLEFYDFDYYIPPTNNGMIKVF